MCITSGRVLAAMSAAVFVLLTCGPVAAETDSTKPVTGLAPETGVDFNRTPYALSVADETKALGDLYELYGKALNGAAVSPTQVARAEQSVERATGRPAPKLSLQTAVASSSRGGSGKVQVAATDVHKLSVAHAAQKFNYYCGPATGFMILRYKGRTKSAAEPSVSLGQSELAGSGYMQTYAKGSTNWGDGDFPRGFNRWYGSKYYVQLNSPTRNKLMGAIVANIVNGKPVATATFEAKNQAHYNGHPRDQKVRHWVATNGYIGNGDVIISKDPSTSVWADAEAEFEISATSLTSFVSTYGIAT
jgi:hypothetical protein